MHLSPTMETNLVRGWRVASVRTCACARSLRGMLSKDTYTLEKEREREKGRETHVPVLIQKADHTRPARFNVTGLVLLAGFRDLACVVISADGDDSAETPALRIKSFFYKAL